MLYRVQSGDVDGQSKCWITSLSRNLLTRWALCGCALPSINMRSEPTAPLKSHTYCSSTGYLCLWISRVLLKKMCRSVCPFNIMLPHMSISPLSSGDLSIMFMGLNQFPYSFQTAVQWESLSNRIWTYWN